MISFQLTCLFKEKMHQKRVEEKQEPQGATGWTDETREVDRKK